MSYKATTALDREHTQRVNICARSQPYATLSLCRTNTLSEAGGALVFSFSTAVPFGRERGIKNIPILHIMPGFPVQADYY